MSHMFFEGASKLGVTSTVLILNLNDLSLSNKKSYCFLLLSHTQKLNSKHSFLPIVLKIMKNWNKLLKSSLIY